MDKHEQGLTHPFWTLFSVFFRVGLFTFGGGYAMLPMIQREVVQKQGWATDEEIMDYYAVGQCTPGVIAVNTATFIGHKIKGNVGGVVATAGMITPSLLIIMALAFCLESFAHLQMVQHAFSGIRVIVCVLVIDAVLKLWKTGVKDWAGVAIFAATFILSVLFSLSPVWIVLAGITAGIVIQKAKGAQ